LSEIAALLSDEARREAMRRSGTADALHALIQDWPGQI
jgi:mannitol/fructose-specific phosphotransferase system IIA component (Ntr-type)